jgi:hypothetical protein
VCGRSRRSRRMPRKSPLATFGRDVAAEIASQLQKRTRSKPDGEIRNVTRQIAQEAVIRAGRSMNLAVANPYEKPM